ncbi:MAG: M1 family metallopeptidase [Actinobacteria bacterium]|nr:MAG: M1 family metallopeptidase [Actinomycetota bacterium]
MRRISTLAIPCAGICLVLVAALVPAAEADQKLGPGHARYEVALRWHASRWTLDGSERISFENTRSHTIRAVWLRLWPNGQASCRRPLITVEIVSGGQAGPSAAACTARKVMLRRELTPGSRAAIRLRFSERVPLGNESYGHVPGGPALLGNALPILAVTDRTGTHLEPYSRLGEAAYSLTSSWRVKLDLRRGLTAATTGTQTGTGSPSSGLRRLRFAAPKARDFELAIGRLHTRTTKAGGVRIRFLDMLPRGSATSKLRREVLASARTTLLADEQRFGPYGAPELDIVQTPTIDAAGMEYPEIVFVEMTDSSAGADSWRKTAALTAHEIAHQWFYGLVGDNQWREPFLDESFATFVSGFPSHPCKPGHPLAGYPTSVRLTSTMGFFDHHPSGDYYGGLYGGGACALRDLRSGFGPVRFDAFLRHWVDTHRYGVATIPEFVSAIRAAAPSGFDVDGYLRASRL